MGIWSNATITQKGYALQGKLLSTNALDITRVVSGAGNIQSGQLVIQTAVFDIKQTLEIENLSYQDSGTAVLKVYLENYQLKTGYTIWQVGIYANDPDEGEILYAIAQANAGEYIPSISEQPAGFSCEWTFYLTFSNGDNISVNITPSAFITQQVADDRYSAKKHTHNVTDVTDLQEKINNKSDINHNHTITDIAELQGTLNEMNTAIKGKAAASHTHAISGISGLESRLNELENIQDISSEFCTFGDSVKTSLSSAVVKKVGNIIFGTITLAFTEKTPSATGDGYFTFNDLLVIAEEYRPAMMGVFHTIFISSDGYMFGNWTVLKGTGNTFLFNGTGDVFSGILYTTFSYPLKEA